MFDLNGWCLDKSRFVCQNVIVYNLDIHWFIQVDGKELDMNFYWPEDALNEAEKYINWGEEKINE